MHTLDSLATAGTTTFISANALDIHVPFPGDESGQLAKIILTACIGIIAPMVQGALKQLWNKWFPKQ